MKLKEFLVVFPNENMVLYSSQRKDKNGNPIDLIAELVGRENSNICTYDFFNAINNKNCCFSEYVCSMIKQIAEKEIVFCKIESNEDDLDMDFRECFEYWLNIYVEDIEL